MKICTSLPPPKKKEKKKEILVPLKRHFLFSHRKGLLLHRWSILLSHSHRRNTSLMCRTEYLSSKRHFQWCSWRGAERSGLGGSPTPSGSFWVGGAKWSLTALFCSPHLEWFRGVGTLSGTWLLRPPLAMPLEVPLVRWIYLQLAYQHCLQRGHPPSHSSHAFRIIHSYLSRSAV